MLIVNTWYSLLDACYLILVKRYLLPDAYYLMLSTQYLVPVTTCDVRLLTWYLLTYTYCLILCSWYLLPYHFRFFQMLLNPSWCGVFSLEDKLNSLYKLNLKILFSQGLKICIIVLWKFGNFVRNRQKLFFRKMCPWTSSDRHDQTEKDFGGAFYLTTTEKL